VINENLIDYLESDDSFTMQEQENIVKKYERATNDQKKVVDGVFINLCGFSLGTLIEELEITTLQ